MMSSAAAACFVSTPAASTSRSCLTHLSRRSKAAILNSIPISCQNYFSSSRSVLFGGTFVLRNHTTHGRCVKKRSFFTAVRPFSPVMEWQDCTVKMEVDVPTSVAYDCYADRESIPRWMPFISTVKILEDKPDLSRWSLKYKAFGQDLEFSWLARNMQPIPNQKIHWRSLEGLPNRGAVRFYPKGPSSCLIELTVSYEVPQLLVPVTAALQPLLEGLLRRGLESFAAFAKSSQTG